MNGRSNEGVFAMDVSEILKKAWDAVDGAGLPEAVRPIAFQEAVRLLAPDAPAAAPPMATGRDDTGSASLGGPANGAERRSDVPEEEIYDRVVEHTGVDRAKVEQVVHLDDDGLRVSLPGLRLGRNNAERTRAVAQILTIARGFGLGENETPLEVIRGECNRLKVYDSANFSAHVGKLNGYVVSGSGLNRRLRAKSPGIQAFPALVDALVSDS
jgi:hypothetical protein